LLAKIRPLAIVGEALPGRAGRESPPLTRVRAQPGCYEEQDMNLFRLLGRTALLLAGLSLVCLTAAVHGRPDKSDSKVKITAEASVPDAEGRQLVVLNLAIEKGWHLYANPVGNKDLEGAQTNVLIKAGQPLRDVKINYPAGKVEKDKTVGDYSIYEGT